MSKCYLNLWHAMISQPLQSSPDSLFQLPSTFCYFLCYLYICAQEEIVPNVKKNIAQNRKIYFFFLATHLQFSFIVTCFLLILISSSCLSTRSLRIFAVFPFFLFSSGVNVDVIRSASHLIYEARKHFHSFYCYVMFFFLVEVNFYGKLQFHIKRRNLVQCLHSSLISCSLVAFLLKSNGIR